MRLYNNSIAKTRRRELRKNQTNAEKKIWSILRNKQMGGLKFFRQYSVGPYILDFYCPKRKYAVELDGSQHGEELQQQHDIQRTQYLAQQKICVLRFWNNEVLTNLEGVWQKINEELKAPLSQDKRGRG